MAGRTGSRVQLLERPLQNYANCRAVEYPQGVLQPQRMSEFVRTREDNGGVHSNRCIIDRAYYLLAARFPNAIGIRAAERVFDRALTTYPVRNSQFVDARLAASDLFGPASTRAQRTAEALDAVEIFDSETTPPPPPFPPVAGPDALLFVFDDAGQDEFFPGRREAGLGDPPPRVQLSAVPVAPKRPAVSGDGQIAAFAFARNDLCLTLTEAEFESAQECLGRAGLVHSVAMAPDSSKFGFVLLDARGQPEHVITLVDLRSQTAEEVPLAAPSIDGQQIGTVEFADVMDFTADGRFLIYDAYNSVPVAGSEDLALWSVYAYDLLLRRTLVVVPPVPGHAVGNPSLRNTSDNFLLLDVFAQGENPVVAANLTDGSTAEVALTGDTPGLPAYKGDDSAVLYMVGGPETVIGTSLVRWALAADRITPSGPQELVRPGAAAGVIYRRGPYGGPAPTLTPTPVTPRQTPAPTATAPGPMACTGDCNED